MALVQEAAALTNRDFAAAMSFRRVMRPIPITVVVVALLLTYFTYPPNGYITLERLKWMAVPLAFIELPSASLAALVSGNVHQPEPITWWAALFLTYLLLVGAACWLVVIGFRKVTTKRSEK